MAINLSNVGFCYPDNPEERVLTIPSWSLNNGEQAFIHGPSGGGKSTLLGLLSGMLPVSEGEITILGERFDQMNARQRDRFRANNIGYVFQQFNLIPYLSAIDNVRLACQFSKQTSTRHIHSEITALLTSLNLPEIHWHKPSRKLSIGQQQRVAIARALINKPKILIADEPTSSLDQANRDAFMAILLPLVSTNNITLLFVSHDMSLSHYFYRVESLCDINNVNVAQSFQSSDHVLDQVLDQKTSQTSQRTNTANTTHSQNTGAK